MPDMAWTSESPQRSGWYWYRSPAVSGIVHIHLVRTSWHTDEKGWSHEQGSRDGPPLSREPGIEWYGPLVAPP